MDFHGDEMIGWACADVSKLRRLDFVKIFGHREQIPSLDLLPADVADFERKALLVAGFAAQGGFEREQRFLLQHLDPLPFDHRRTETARVVVALQQTKGKQSGIADRPDAKIPSTIAEGMERAFHSLNRARLVRLL